MRISSEEIADIVQSIDQHIVLTQAELRLYGSRLHDHSRGGDIDLLLVASVDEQYQEILQKKPIILVEIKNKIGDQKIDLVIVRRNGIRSDPFVDLIYDTSQCLHQWP